MKQIGIIGMVVILIIFGTPLIEIKQVYKTMEYEEIGNVMLNNVENYVVFLDSTSNVANTAIDFVEKTVSKISDFINSIADFIKGIYENLTGNQCTGDYNEGWYCGSSEGGGGGSMGGR